MDPNLVRGKKAKKGKCEEADYEENEDFCSWDKYLFLYWFIKSGVQNRVYLATKCTNVLYIGLTRSR